METKKCTKCGEEKALVDFPKKTSNKDGRGAYCKACLKLEQHAYYATHAEEFKSRFVDYRAKDRRRYSAYNARRIKALVPSYVARTLRLPLADCPPELIELKRQQLQLSRVTKQLKKELQK